MYYWFKLNEFPEIYNIYTVTRNTVWQISDNYNILIFIKHGECEITFNNQVFHLQRGDVFFIPAHHSYTRRAINNTMCTMEYIHFSFSTEFTEIPVLTLIQKIADTKYALDTEILSGSSKLSQSNEIYIQNKSSIKECEKIFSLIDDMRMFSSHRQLMCGLQSTINLCNLFIYLSQNTLEYLASDTTLKDEPLIAPNLKKAIRYIAHHHTEKITLDTIASHCHISKQQLIRYFKAAFNTTPINYITDYRIARAKDLLFNHPDLTIKEISSELGFENQHYFTRVFTRKTGENPTNYRDRISNYNDKTDMHREHRK